MTIDSVISAVHDAVNVSEKFGVDVRVSVEVLSRKQRLLVSTEAWRGGRCYQGALKDIAIAMGQEVELDPRLVAKLQAMRSTAGRLITISSGYRTLEHSGHVGGSPNSQHLYGEEGGIPR